LADDIKVFRLQGEAATAVLDHPRCFGDPPRPQAF
jgi:hypothetical protein|tara:strand:- start:3999 stop:4103 length:105 start_codon:yes stop_codon:yes gene_type:complete